MTDAGQVEGDDMQAHTIFEHLVTLVGHLVWPATLIILALLIRKEVTEFIRSLAERVRDPHTDFALGREGMSMRFSKLVERTSRLEAEQKKQEDQEKADLTALEYVDIQLGETIAPKFSRQALMNAILNASPRVLEFIYQKTKETRHLAWKDRKRGLIERTIPVFQTLVASEHGAKRHRYYAQLGYALKDQEVKDWIGAKQNLEKAIELWRQENHSESTLPFYSFNWVLCAIVLDNEHYQLDESEPGLRSRIVKAIQAGRECDPLAKALRESEAVQTWLHRNRHSVSPDLLNTEPPTHDCDKEEADRGI